MKLADAKRESGMATMDTEAMDGELERYLLLCLLHTRTIHVLLLLCFQPPVLSTASCPHE
jgi:hypothetical protein